MKVFNCTPHAIQIYSPADFVGLEQVNPTSWVADGVEGEPIAEYHPEDAPVRIATKTVAATIPGVIHVLGEVVATEYGELTGVPEGFNPLQDWLIVSLPAQSMARQAGHPLASRMLAPYKVVRSRANGSVVLGCMGVTL